MKLIPTTNGCAFSTGIPRGAANLLCMALVLLILVSGCVGPTPTLELTPSLPPTDTSTPTNIPIPTDTSIPTDTPIPTDTSTPAPSATLPPTATPTTPPVGLFEKFQQYPWVAYTPTHYNPEPDARMEPTSGEIRADLDVLYAAGFRGIVTYGSTGMLAEIPRIAREAGFDGVVIGIWQPDDAAEIEAAVQVAGDVDGYVVGNEGISFSRYDLAVLEKGIAAVRSATGKPVTTSEPFSQYYKLPQLFTIGDWVFPNMHPYWQGITAPSLAVDWTVKTYQDFKAKAGSLSLVLKEVGLPSQGVPVLSEYQQAEYYVRLRDSGISFVYFEAFDQPWKKEGETEIGSYWGLFTAEREAKVISKYVLRGYSPFYVYDDARAPHNHFVPEGWMGCIKGVQLEENDTSNPHQGKSAIRITYQPGTCDQGFAGIYWWTPAGGDWCEKEAWFDLTGWTEVSFYARGQKGGEPVGFKVGGVQHKDGSPCCSITLPQTTYPMYLTDEWVRYTIPLYGHSLEHVVGGFVWVTDSKEPITIYLDDIQFEWHER